MAGFSHPAPVIFESMQFSNTSLCTIITVTEIDHPAESIRKFYIKFTPDIVKRKKCL